MVFDPLYVISHIAESSQCVPKIWPINIHLFHPRPEFTVFICITLEIMSCFLRKIRSFSFCISTIVKYYPHTLSPIKKFFHKILYLQVPTSREMSCWIPEPLKLAQTRFIKLKKFWISVGRELLNIILIEFRVPMKLVWLINMWLNETCSKIQIGK